MPGRSWRVTGAALSALILLLAVRPSLSQSSEPRNRYLNPTLPLEQRVDDLVSRMTLAEKVSQMQNDAPPIPRLQIPGYNWWNEGLHGVARSGYATVFPQAIGLAATWDTALIGRVGDTISTEARAKYNQAQREGNRSIFYGLTLWSPNINIVRDPRWGRGQETYGEDPFLTGSIGEAFVRGLQGSDPRYLKVVATAKHFAVHSGPESERHNFNVRVSPHDLEDTYLPAFRKLIVDAHADSVMCAYNSVDGSPACANETLLQQTLKTHWGFSGFIVSDCGAITDIFAGHHFAADMQHAAALSVKAGTDLSCGKEFAALTDAVHEGLIDESEIDTSVRRLFAARFRLGMFDPPAMVPYNRISFSENDSAKHGTLALEAARASIILLKNERGALPLRDTHQTVAVVGPNAASLPALEGNYNAIASHPVTPLDALEHRMHRNILYAQGSPYVEGIPVVVPPTVFSSNANGVTTPGLKAEYFSGKAFTGSPAIERIDRAIDFDWNAAAPAPGVSGESFSVRWTGSITAPAPGTIRFGFSMAHCSTCEDEETVRVWLDGKPVYEFIHAPTHGRRAPTTQFKMTFNDTLPHPIRIEYGHDSPRFGAGLTFNWEPPLDVLRDQAVAAARQSDVVVAFLGLSPEIEGEEMPVHVSGFDGGDRSAIELPAAQTQLMDALAATGKPIILVLMNGSALALADAGQKASAILEAWYPGESGGTAIAETLFGENNPSGRLPLTFYAGTNQLPPFDDYSMKARTYRYFTGTPLYPFGFGLSYTRFRYSNGDLASAELHAGAPLAASVEVENAGDRDGDETVEAYLMPKGKPGAARWWLAGFEKVHLSRGQTKTIHISIDPRQLSLVDADGSRSIQPGDYELYLGGGQPKADSGVSLPFRMRGLKMLEP
ncbi:MAG: glycoside hydrolase family 3 C-terminal domain-containing protein [Terracidiphilus sp.]